jgi:hypothetical protein
MVHGFIPGPDMLTKHLDMTYSMVWSIALANIFGAGLCFLLSGQFARIATLRFSLILPVIMPVVFVGAFEGSRSWGDLFVLLIAGAIGWTMKRLKWARPPLILGTVLGVLIERYMSISVMRYGIDWMTRPGVLALLTVSGLVFLSPLYRLARSGGLARMRPSGKVAFKPADLMYVFFIGIALYMLATAQQWIFMARIGPTVVASILIAAGTISLANKVFFTSARAAQAQGGIHMDVGGDYDGAVPENVATRRAMAFLGWLLGFLACTSVIGLIPTVPLFIVAFMRVEGRESWRTSTILAICVTAFLYGIFDQVLHIPWPSSLLGEWFPALAIGGA